MTEHTTKAVRRAWMWVGLWVLVIGLESFAGSAENTGRILLPLLHWLWPHMRLLTYFQIHFWIRKIGHLSGYAMLGLLSFRAWWVTFQARKTSAQLTWRAMASRFDLRAAAEAVLVVMAVAAMDEWHQSFSRGRTSSINDVMLDTMGGIFAQLVMLNISEWRRKRRRGTQQSAVSIQSS